MSGLMKSILDLLVGIGLVILYVFLSYFLLWNFAVVFDLEFIQEPTWRQYWGMTLIMGLFIFPHVYNKAKREVTDNTPKFITDQLTLILGLGVIYLMSLLLNWLL